MKKQNKSKPKKSKSTASSLLRFAGIWLGTDLEKCLKDVKSVRG